MADTKISALTAASDLVSAEIPVAQGGVTKRAASSLFSLPGHTHTLANISDVTASVTEVNYTDGVTSAIQTQLDGKAASSHTHTASQISDLTATATELNYTDGVTSAIQTQLDGKQPLDTQLTDLAGLAYAANGGKFIRVNAGATAFELASIAGGGDVTGDDTSTVTQNIVAYSSTGGKNITELTGTGGDVLYYDGGTSSWVKLARGTYGQVLAINSGSTVPEWAYPGAIHYSKSSGATTTGANTTPVDVSGAVFSYVANGVYKIWVMGRVNSTAATTGVGIHFNLSSAVTSINIFNIHPLASSTNSSSYSISDDASEGVSSGVPSGPLDVPFVLNGLLICGANTGTAQLRLRSETTAVTELLAGVVMVVERLA